jgi:N-ethylmaleimide reductase
MHGQDDDLLREIRDRWPTALVVNRGGRTRQQLISDLDSGLADIITVGQWALANPDLVERLRRDAPLNEANPATFYGGGTEGYTDYPVLDGR